MRRRDFVLGTGAWIATPLLANAQSAQLPTVAIISSVESVSDVREGGSPYWSAFLGELKRLGWLDRKNVRIEPWSADNEEPEAAYMPVIRQAVANRPTVVVAFGYNNIRVAASIAGISHGQSGHVSRASLSRPAPPPRAVSSAARR